MMDAAKIDQIIERYRPLEIFSSYPVLTEDGAGNKLIVWFYFDIPEDGDDEEVRIIVQEAYCMDQAYEVTTKAFAVDEVVDYELTEDPEYEYEDYMSALTGLIDNYSEEKMRALISATEQAFIADIAFRAAALFA